MQRLAENANLSRKAAMANLSTDQESKDLGSNPDTTVYKLCEAEDSTFLISTMGLMTAPDVVVNTK